MKKTNNKIGLLTVIFMYSIVKYFKRIIRNMYLIYISPHTANHQSIQHVVWNYLFLNSVQPSVYVFKNKKGIIVITHVISVHLFDQVEGSGSSAAVGRDTVDSYFSIAWNSSLSCVLLERQTFQWALRDKVFIFRGSKNFQIVWHLASNRIWLLERHTGLYLGTTAESVFNDTEEQKQNRKLHFHSFCICIRRYKKCCQVVETVEREKKKL